MLCRVADDLFWMSRYVERAISACRLVDVTLHLELDAGDTRDTGSPYWMPLLGTRLDGIGGVEIPELSGREVRVHLSFDPANPNSLITCVRQARAAAMHVRESISTEMWEQLNALYLSLNVPDLKAYGEEDPYTFYRRVRAGAQLFQGLAECTLVHDERWQFICLGMYLERADNVARVLGLQANLLDLRPTALDDASVRWLAVLRSCGAAEAYAHYYSLRVEPARVLEFLLLNPIFPQSIGFSLAAARAALMQIANGAGSDVSSPAARAMARLCARLETAAVDEVIEDGLVNFLDGLHRGVADVAEQVTKTYLRDESLSMRAEGVERAALIMAAQQQQ